MKPANDNDQAPGGVSAWEVYARQMAAVEDLFSFARDGQPVIVGIDYGSDDCSCEVIGVVENGKIIVDKFRIIE